ncbi:hypothetical protein MRB53_024983 [Persea americana]|uniref:Uncharacterized protein n=1 Tax=Persea americana TaxID=3435 RepID=A0ACC2LE97_PERAE|nr:hypothetical protein MRB53_024983 [Persea americana]
MESEDDELSLKLLIDNTSQKVMFAEAQKDLVDFLFSLLALPLGSVIRLLKNHSMEGSIGNLYESIGNLSNTYVQPGLDKNILLNPEPPNLPFGKDRPLLLLQNDARPKPMKFYTCSGSSSHSYVTDVAGTTCPSCNYGMTIERTYVAKKAVGSSSVGGGGFVKPVVTYTVMDDLVVKPMSTISSIALLKKFNVRDVGDLEERVVQVGMDEGLAILKASFKSKTVLTDIFLGNEMKAAA